MASLSPMPCCRFSCRACPQRLSYVLCPSVLQQVQGTPSATQQTRPACPRQTTTSLSSDSVLCVLQLLQLQEPLPATEEEVACVHQSEYVQRVRETAANAKPGEPTVVADFDDPDGFTYVHQSSFADALQVRSRCLMCHTALCRVTCVVHLHASEPVETQGRCLAAFAHDLKAA